MIFGGVAMLLGVDLGGRGRRWSAVSLSSSPARYAIGGFIVKHRLGELAPVAMSGLVMAAAAVLMLPIAFTTAPDELPGLGPAAAVATLGVVGTGIAFVIFYGLIGRRARRPGIPGHLHRPCVRGRLAPPCSTRRSPPPPSAASS